MQDYQERSWNSSVDKNELEAIDRKTRRLNMCKRLYSRPHVDWLYGQTKTGGKGLIRVEESVRVEKTLGFRRRLMFLQKEQEQLLREVAIEGVISDDENPKDKQH